MKWWISIPGHFVQRKVNNLHIFQWVQEPARELQPKWRNSSLTVADSLGTQQIRFEKPEGACPNITIGFLPCSRCGSYKRVFFWVVYPEIKHWEQDHKLGQFSFEKRCSSCTSCCFTGRGYTKGRRGGLKISCVVMCYKACKHRKNYLWTVDS